MQTHTMIHRRGLLTGLGALIAAPAIVRAASLMPVRRPPLAIYDLAELRKMLFRDYVLGEMFTRFECAENGTIRITAIPPEQFYRTD